MSLTVHKKRILIIGCICALCLLLLGGIVLVGTNAAVILSARRHIGTDAAAQCAIVPGAHVYQDGRPSDFLKDRLDKAYELYSAGRVGKILVSGDRTGDYDEVSVMRGYLMDKGVPEEDIFSDYGGFNTYLTMYRAAIKFRVRSAVIVTQRYHLYRAVYIARAMGMEASGEVCDNYVSVKQPWFSAREVLARTKDFFLLLSDAPNNDVGDICPIDGDGRATT